MMLLGEGRDKARDVHISRTLRTGAPAVRRAHGARISSCADVGTASSTSTARSSSIGSVPKSWAASRIRSAMALAPSPAQPRRIAGQAVVVVQLPGAVPPLRHPVGHAQQRLSRRQVRRSRRGSRRSSSMPSSICGSAAAATAPSVHSRSGSGCPALARRSARRPVRVGLQLPVQQAEEPRDRARSPPSRHGLRAPPPPGPGSAGRAPTRRRGPRGPAAAPGAGRGR